MKYLLAGFLTSLLATVDQLYVMQKSACLAALTTLLLISVSTHVVVNLSADKANKPLVFLYALGAAAGTFLAVKLF